MPIDAESVQKLKQKFLSLFGKKSAKTQTETLKLQNEVYNLQLKNAQLATALYNITEGAVVLDLNRNILFVNKAAENLIGISASKIIGKPISQVIKLYDTLSEITDMFYSPINSDVPEGKVFVKNGLRLVSAIKKESYVNLTSKEIKANNKLNIGCVMALYDSTRETQLEKMKMDFVSMAAHELRTPLTSMKGYLSVIIDEGKNLNEDQKSFLNRITISVDQLLGLVENLLNVTRIERGTLALAREQIDMVAIAKQLVQDIQNRAKEKQIKLEYVETLQVVPFIKADKIKITEVAANLINNAINYTPSGGIVKVWVEKKDNEVIFHSSDNGPGIPPDAQKRLFVKFYRVISKLGQNSKGTGLGLYISKAIIDLHHGKIWVDSEVGKGSTFSFSLPITEH